MLKLGKFSVGVGDRFAQQATAQLRACQLAEPLGIAVEPVWNKSNREHLIVHSEPGSVREAAARAVQELGWTRPWHVDADHIRLETVDRFIPSSDFFTLDVADSIGKPASDEALQAFVNRHPELVGELPIPGIDDPLASNRETLERIAAQYLSAIQDAAAIYKHVAKSKNGSPFITEVSMDETDRPQTPLELLVILAALADERVPLQTIAPKFTGRFNKGVDYAGNVSQFEQEFNDDLAVLAFAVKKYNLPGSLKLSVHSGSDKFSIYTPIRRALQRFDAGLHLKTAGTTWLEEIIGLAESDGPGLVLAREIYCESLARREELCQPYATVIDIDPTRLPSAETVERWTSSQFVGALRHDPRCPEFNPHLRQLLHVGYKIAALKGERFLDAVRQCRTAISRNVTHNLLERHLKPLFAGIH